MSIPSSQNALNSIHFNPPKEASCWSRLVEIISHIALAIFYAFAIWCSPFLFTIGFFVGAFYSEEVKARVTEVFKKMSWKWVIPTAALLYSLFLPATLTMQGILTGLDLGSRWSQWAKS